MRRLEHIGIATDDAHRMASVLETILGRRPYARETVDREGVRTTFIEAGAVKLELVEAVDPDSALGRYLERHGPGMHHLAFEVDDLEATYDRLETAGFRLLGRPSAGADGKRIFFVHPKDTGGILVEFCQDRPGSATVLDGSGPEGAPACLVIGPATEWKVVRALTRRLRIWYVPGGGRHPSVPAGHVTVALGPGPADQADVLVDPDPAATAPPGSLVILRGDREPPAGAETVVRLPEHVLAGLPDPDSTLADLVAAHLTA